MNKKLILAFLLYICYFNTSNALASNYDLIDCDNCYSNNDFEYAALAKNSGMVVVINKSTNMAEAYAIYSELGDKFLLPRVVPQ